MVNLDSVNKKDLSRYEFKKNFLFSEEGNCYFYERFNNLAFILDEKNKNNQSKIKDNFNKYIGELIEVCQLSENKPSIICLGNDIKSNEAFKPLTIDNIDLINEPNTLFKIENESEFDSIVMSILKDRSDIQKFLKSKEVFVVVDNIDKLNLASLVRHMIVAKSRKVYFILLINSQNTKSNDLNYQFLLSNCIFKFICNDEKVEKIEGRYNEILKEFA